MENNTQTRRQTIEQERAAAAWKSIEDVTRDAQEKYGTLARKLATMIQMNGLGTAMAFLKSKGKNNDQDGHILIYQHVSEWVLKRLGPQCRNSEEECSKDKEHQIAVAEFRNRYPELMDFIRNVDMKDYRWATTEAIEYAIWLKRYVEAKDWGSSDGDTT